MISRSPKPRSLFELKWLSKLCIDPVLGVIKTPAGELVGHVNTGGYIQIGGPITTFRRCHIIWWKATGAWPTRELDHIVQCKTNDAFINLREVSTRENCANRKDSTQRDLPVGVYRIKGTSRFQAKIYVSGKYKSLGYYDSVEEAATARKTAEAAL